MTQKQVDRLLEEFDDHAGKVVVNKWGDEGEVKFTFLLDGKLRYRLTSGMTVSVADWRLKTSTLLHKNELYRDDIYAIDTSVAEYENWHDKANYLLGYYGKKMIQGKTKVPLFIGDGWMIVRTFFREMDIGEIHDQYYPVKTLPLHESKAVDHA